MYLACVLALANYIPDSPSLHKCTCTHITLIRRGLAAPHVYAQRAHSQRACGSACVRAAHSFAKGVQRRTCTHRALLRTNLFLTRSVSWQPGPSPAQGLFVCPVLACALREHVP